LAIRKQNVHENSSGSGENGHQHAFASANNAITCHNRAMHLVAVVGGELNLHSRLAGYRDPQHHYHLHPVSPQAYTQLAAGLRSLEFAGALIFEAALQREAATSAERASLVARTLAAADLIAPTMVGMVADLTVGRAVAAALQARVWNARGARVAVLGADLSARAVARELASQGIAHLSVHATARADAERVIASVTALPEVAALAAREPNARLLLERADLVVRTESGYDIPPDLFGPHLALVDLDPAPLSRWRQRGVEAGALTVGAFDVMAHRLQLALSTILASPVAIAPLQAWLLAEEGDSSLSKREAGQ
jgi:shikimate 5-dehydrogenase